MGLLYTFSQRIYIQFSQKYDYMYVIHVVPNMGPSKFGRHSISLVIFSDTLIIIQETCDQIVTLFLINYITFKICIDGKCYESAISMHSPILRISLLGNGCNVIN